MSMLRWSLVWAILIASVTLPFAQREASALTFTDMRAQFSFSTDRSGADILSLLVNRSAFGMPGGFGIGAVSGVTPDDNMPMALLAINAVSGIPPDDGMPAYSFTFTDADEVSGIDPTPFRLLVADMLGTLLYELDFVGSTGVVGSLTLSNVGYYILDDLGERTGERLTLDPFTIQAVPLPAALPLLLSTLGALGFMGWLRQRASV